MNEPLRGKLKPLREDPATADKVEVRLDKQCYCCEDTGIIVFPEWILEDPKTWDPPLLCKRCSAAVKIYGETIHKFDQRATREICNQIHEWNREQWITSIKLWQQQKQSPKAQEVAEQIKAISDGKKMSQNPPRDPKDIEF